MDVTTHGDFLVGRIALERGLLSEEQLADCLQDQRKNAGEQLGTIMLRRGLIGQSDLDSLLEERKRRLSDALDLSDPKLEDVLLGRILVRQGLVKEAQVYECLRVIAEMGEAGRKPPRLGELLVRKGHLPIDTVDRTLLDRKKQSLHCPSCRAKFSSSSAKPGRKPSCLHCGELLELREDSGETTDLIRIGMPEDAARAAKDPTRQFASGRYILVEEVGRGGMGVVWKAWQTDLKRFVALKILAGSMWTEPEVKRFYREARMAAALSHPNIASIYEVGSYDGKHFIAMEFVDGDSLARLLPRTGSSKQGTARSVRPLPARKAIEILRQVALAVDYAHSKSIIHRDLKPHNIMVQRADGRVYVMDFGLAKPIRGHESITISDAIVGTPQFMSPEQARGDQVDHRTDVYGLGAVLYSTLAARPPFDGPSPAATMLAVLGDDPEPLRRINPRVHSDVQTICEKALEKDPDRRYDSARSLADDLGRYLEGEPITARPHSPREKLWKSIRNRPLVSLLITVGVAAALLLGIVLLVIDARTRSKVDALTAKARVSLDEKDPVRAREFIKQALAHDPNDLQAQIVLDLIDRHIWDLATEKRDHIRNLRETAARAFTRNDHDEALRLYREILILAAEDPVARSQEQLCLKRIKEEKDRGKAAVKVLKGRVAELEAEKLQRDEEERGRRNRRSYARPYYERAIAAMESAARIKPGSAAGATFDDIRRIHQSALSSLTLALREDETYAEAYSLRGRLHQWLGEYHVAEGDFINAMRHGGSTGTAALGAAMANLALFMIHATVPQDVQDTEIQDLTLRNIYSRAKQAGDSADGLEAAIGKALVNFHQANHAAAVEGLHEAGALGRGSYAYHFALACIHLEKRDDPAALEDLRAAVDLSPTSPEALFLRAVVKTRLADLDGALEDATRAIEASPDDYLAYLLRADLHRRLESPIAAGRDLGTAVERAVKRAPKRIQKAINALANRWTREANPK